MRNRISICSNNSTSGYLSKRTEAESPTDICTPTCTGPMFSIAKGQKQPKRPLMDEHNGVHPHKANGQPQKGREA